MTAAAFPHLPVRPGADGVAAVADAVARLLDTGGSGFELVTDQARPVRPHPSDGPAPTAIVVGTSGSTGSPQRVVVPLSALTASAELGSAALGPPGPWLTAVPVTGVGGLLTVVRSLIAGERPTAWRGVGGAHPFPGSFAADSDAVISRAAAHGRPAYLSLVPTQLHRVLTDPVSARAAAGFAAVLVGGAALAPAIRRSAEAAGLRVVSTYGATETAGGVVFDGVPLPRVDVRITDGRIEIGGPTIAAGYLDGSDESLSDGWFRSSDAGEWVDGRLVVLGRQDDLIKVGGDKVSLAAITRVLTSDDRVLDAATIAQASVEWGHVPRAFVVPVDPTAGADLLEELGDAVTAALGRRHRPPTMTLVSQIPVTPAGKPIRATES